MLRFTCLSMTILALSFLVSCSTNTPIDLSDLNLVNEEETGNRLLMGYYTVDIDPDRSTADLHSNRPPGAHVNSESYLLGWPCGNCLKIKNLRILPGNLVECDIEVTHPMVNPVFTVMDLRVIAVFPADDVINSYGYSLALLNRDGMTTLWDNPSIPGTINGYKAYNKSESRRPFEPGDVLTEHFVVQLPDGALSYDIAVDSSWAPNDGVNFPSDMNSLEVIDLTGEVSNNLTIHGGSATLTVEAYDYQETYAVDEAVALSDDLFIAPKDLNLKSSDGHNLAFELEISNEKLAPSGTYDILVRVTDIEDPNYPSDLSSYLIIPVTVEIDDIEVTLAEADDYYRMENYYKFYSYAGAADHNVVDYLDPSGWWDFTQIAYPYMWVRKILTTDDPNVAEFKGDFPDADRFVMHWGNYGLDAGTFFIPQYYSYPLNILYEPGLYEVDHFFGSVVFDTPSEVKFPYNKDTNFTRYAHSGLTTITWQVQAVGLGHCIIPLDGLRPRDSLLVRSEILLTVASYDINILMYEWFDDDGTLLAVIYATNYEDLPAHWNETTKEISYGSISAMYEMFRQ